MWKLAWDFFLSFSIRTGFTLALFGGVNFLTWTYYSWRGGFWKDNPQMAQLSFLLAGALTLVAFLGTFRKGKAEARFSLFSLVTVATGAIGHIHFHNVHVGERTLHRFPSTESFLLGSSLIALWLLHPFWEDSIWVLRNGAMVGAVQIIWGAALEILGDTTSLHAGKTADESPRDSADTR